MASKNVIFEIEGKPFLRGLAKRRKMEIAIGLASLALAVMGAVLGYVFPIVVDA